MPRRWWGEAAETPRRGRALTQVDIRGWGYLPDVHVGCLMLMLIAAAHATMHVHIMHACTRGKSP